MKFQRLALPLALAGAILGTGIASAALSQNEAPRAFEPSGFSFEHEISVPGSPNDVYDAFTGDVKPWWDHTVSKSPKSLVIEAQPGGQFLETFDDSGDGVQHALVTLAQRGKMLRMVGPLGLAGLGIDLEMTFVFAPQGDGTRVHLTVHGQGRVEKDTAVMVQRVWHHFLDGRFVPYVTSKHEQR